MDLYTDKQIVQWIRVQMNDRPLRSIMEELQERRIAAAIIALQKGTTEFEKGVVAGYDSVLSVFDQLLNYADTETETANS